MKVISSSTIEMQQKPTLYSLLLKRVQGERSLLATEAENLNLNRALEKERSEKEALAQTLRCNNSKAGAADQNKGINTGEPAEATYNFKAAENEDGNDVIIKTVSHDKAHPVEEMNATSHSAASVVCHEETSSTFSFSIRDAVEEIQRWLFMEGGHMKGVEELITEYCVHVRELGIPLDRLFVGGLMLHPQVSAYVWKWETNCPFDGHEIPRKDFEQKKKLYSNDEPFTILLDGRAEQVRMRASDDYIPKGCQWFLEERYQDYLALPIKHRDEFKGGMAWSTKSPNGFGEEEIEFFSVRSRLSPLCCASTPTIWS
jgi:hypothetical protein